MDKIIVTGGLGFIGSNFVRRVFQSRKNIQLVNVDYMGQGSNLSNLVFLSKNPRYKFVKGDTANSGLWRKIIKDARFIVNFAAETHVDRSISNPDKFLRSNVIGTFTLLEECRKARIEKIVHISTDEVYGSIEYGSFTEKSPLNPSSPYSATKAAADVLARAWCATYELPVVTFRCTNNFGPFQHPEKFIPKAIIRALRGMPITLYGGGRQIRDWIYVEDFCAAIERGLEKGVPGEIYNISAGNELTNREMAEKVLRELGKPVNMITNTKDRPGHDYRYSLSSNKARRDLSWKPARMIGEALSLTVKWYMENRKWWAPLASSKVLSARPWEKRW